MKDLIKHIFSNFLYISCLCLDQKENLCWLLIYQTPYPIIYKFHPQKTVRFSTCLVFESLKIFYEKRNGRVGLGKILWIIAEREEDKK